MKILVIKITTHDNIIYKKDNDNSNNYDNGNNYNNNNDHNKTIVLLLSIVMK